MNYIGQYMNHLIYADGNLSTIIIRSYHIMGNFRMVNLQKNFKNHEPFSKKISLIAST